VIFQIQSLFLLFLISVSTNLSQTLTSNYTPKGIGIYLEKSTALDTLPKPNLPLVVTVNYLLIYFFQDTSKSKALLILDFKVASPTLVEAPITADKF